MKRLPLKEPNESYIHEVGFEELTGTGEDIASVTLERRVLKTLTGAGVTAADADSVAPSVLASADTARVALMSGTHDHVYLVQVAATTTLGNVWVEQLILPIWDLEKAP